MVVVGTDLPSSRLAIELAEAHPGVWATVGFHPNRADALDLGAVAELARHAKVVAVGEIGLDLHWDDVPLEVQVPAFRAQLALARDLDLPVVIHCRDAHQTLLELLEKEPPTRMVLHCFSGDRADAERGLALGAYLGFDGPITFKKSEATRKLLAELPRDRVLLETDSPYLSPHPFRSKPNRPAWLKLVNETLADAWGVEPSESAHITTENALRFYGLGSGS